MADPAIVIGAGPAGLAVAACLKERGVAHRLIDRAGAPGGAYRAIHDGMTLASPSVLNTLPGLRLETATDYTTVVEYRDYLCRYAAHHRLTVERGVVERVARDGKEFLLTVDGATIRAPILIVASGMWDFPVRPALDGAGAVPVLHAREWRGQAAHPEEKIAIVGGATAAIEIAEELGRAGRRSTLLARSGLKISRQRWLGLDVHHWIGPAELIPTWIARSYCMKRPTLPGTDLGFSSLRARGLVDVRPGLARLDGACAVLTDGERLPVDLVVLATGFRFETPFLPPEVTRAPAGHVVAKDGESVAWPGLFLVGAPCAVRVTSEFLRGVAKDAPFVAERVARRLG